MVVKNNKYIGNRYTPKHCGLWDNTKNTAYESLSVVYYGGASYTSVKAIPAGIDILNTSFWVLSAEYNEQMELYRQTVESYKLLTVGMNSDITNLKLRDTNIVSLVSFPQLNGETDDTGRLQRAINSFVGNIAGTIEITGDIRISSQVTCNKTGLLLKGISNRKSRIISTFGGIALFIKPLLNGVPYTSVAYCKFFTENIAIVGEGVSASATGTGLFLQWIYASSFVNLYTSGFAKHVVLKGAHLNTFFNLYQGNMDITDATIETHNRGVGLSGDGVTDEAGESTSNNNHIIGGWLNNCSWDLTNCTGTITEKIDIEPASNSMILGDGCTFSDCRFERFNMYTPEHYPNFPWFIISDNCKIKNVALNQAGSSQYGENVVYRINGKFNEIEINNKIPYNSGLIYFGENAEGNTIKYNGLYTDYQATLLNANYKNEGISIKYNNKKNNRFIFKDNLQGTSADIIGSHTKAQGEFTCYSAKNVAIVNSPDYMYQGLASDIVDIPLPIGRIVGTPSFTKLTLNADNGNRRMSLVGINGIIVSQEGVYTLSATVFVPASTVSDLIVGNNLQANTYITTKDTWITVRSRVYLLANETINPTFQTNGVIGDKFYIGEISVCKGNTSVYIPNATYEPVSASF